MHFIIKKRLLAAIAGASNYFFSKKKVDRQTNTQTHTQVRAENLVSWGPRSLILIFIVCTTLLEKITGGPSGPLAIIYFFQKKADRQTNTQTNKQVRAENSPNKGLIL